MLKINEKPFGREIEATEGWLHLKGSDNYSEIKRRPMLPSQTLDDFEELDELPAYTKAQYDAKVSEFVRERYSSDEEFAIQRKYLASLNGELSPAAAEEFEAYNLYVEQCKADARNPELYKPQDNG